MFTLYVAGMDWLFVCIAAFLASGLTLFSGFGLGTILMPVVAIFFPIPIAVAITAVVHLLNNLFKLGLLWRNVSRRVLVGFGLPALFAAIPGALLLDYLSLLDPVYQYTWINQEHTITPVKLAAGFLLIVFATAEMIPFLSKLTRHQVGLSAGGILSGFFGGLSGHQGAFRSAFLINAGLGKEQFIATNAGIAALVDISRIIIYGLTFNITLIEAQSNLIVLATIAAFLGVFLGAKLVKKVTIGFIQKLVAVMLYLLGGLLVACII
jgi:uncharacterized membrane protein YfcA